MYEYVSGDVDWKRWGIEVGSRLSDGGVIYVH